MLHFFDHPEALSTRLQELLKGASTLFILTDENVSRHCLPILVSACPYLDRAEVIEIEPGESSKSLEIVSHIWQHLLDCGADRNSILLNLGGGVVTDLGGFVASTYKRGIGSIHIPTSLLAMADAAIGGKTGIDFGEIKNSVGTFYQSDVLIYPPFIQTLPQEEITSGFGEMLKTALIEDQKLVASLMALTEFEAAHLEPFIPACAAIKESIVVQDPFEKGNRKLLNLGHTLGHALESCWMKKNIYRPHGLCVILGILAETRVAVDKQICSSAALDELESFALDAFNLIGLQLPRFDELLEFVLQDKKNTSGAIKLVLLRNYGSAEIDIVAQASELALAWDNLKAKLSV